MLVLLAGLAAAAPAHAETFTVSGVADGAGSCDGTTCTTLRAALAAASKAAGPDIINLPRTTRDAQPLRATGHRAETQPDVRHLCLSGEAAPSDGRRPASVISSVIFVYRYDRMRGEEVLQALRRIPEIVQCEVMSGEFDLMLRVDAATPERVHLVWKEISAMPGVSNTVTSFVLSSVI